MNEKIGIIGCGNMGSAMAERLKKDYRVFVFDKDKVKTEGLISLNLAKSLGELCGACEVLLLAVKPQDFDVLLKEIKPQIKNKLLISVAAGLSTKYLEKELGDVRVIRAMPNLGARIGESVTCLCKGEFASEDDLEFADELFSCVGVTRKIEEKLMDAATAISGSGPGYIFDFMDKNGIDPQSVPEATRHDLMHRLERAAESVGFGRGDAAFLAAQTTSCSLNLIRHEKVSPAILRERVASKGGTTEAGLSVLRAGGSWDEAAQAALKRAKELTKNIR